MGGQFATKSCVNRPKNSCSAPGDHARSNSADKISTTRNEGAVGAAVAKRAGLQALRARPFLSVDGCYLRWSRSEIRIGTMTPPPPHSGESQCAHGTGSRFQARADASDQADWRTWG